jgi:MFS family permease
MSSDAQTSTVTTQIPARLDRLPWSRFHWRVVVGLGAVWILDGLEVTMVGSVAARLTENGTGIAINAAQIGIAASIYIVGACLGALFFGQLTDRFGRKKLFIVTLAIYILATVATAFAFAPWYFYLARFFTGAGIGGEYAAINSAIDELIPARVRGRVDLVINGSYWVGAAGGALGAIVLLNEAFLPKDIGWRVAFAIGAIFGLLILLVRRNVPESPRWLFIHGREEEAERIVSGIEDEVRDESDEALSEPEKSLTIRQRTSIPFREIAKVAFSRYPRRALLGLALFIGQAFIYNGVTFNLGTLLQGFFGIASGVVPFFIAIWALSNFAGPVTLGRLFDTIGRKPMITFTYLGSAALTGVLAWVMVSGSKSVWLFMILLLACFFLASSGASAAYLTVSEIFPMETRALAIAFFYAVGTAAGGITGPLLFGELINSGDRGNVAMGFVIAAVVMAVAGIAEIFLGVRAEKANLEDIAQPLTTHDAEEETVGAVARSGEERAAEASDEDRARDQRISARSERRRSEMQRTRYRPGPGQGMYSPWMLTPSSRADDRLLDREVEAIASTVAQLGEVRVEALARDVGARRWGPGRFRMALREALAEGRVVRHAGGTVAPPDLDRG